jgi:hypothetical protein
MTENVARRRNRFCLSAHKRRYSTYGEALSVLDRRLDREGQNSDPFGMRSLIGSVYSCDYCSGWHVSSRKFTVAKPKGRGKRRRGVVERVA